MTKRIAHHCWPLAPRNLIALGLCLTGFSLLPGLGCGGFSRSSPADPSLGQRFALAATPASAAIPSGGSGYVTVSVVRYQGFAGAITLSVENIPSGVVATGSIPGDASTARLRIAVAEGVAVQDLGSLTLLGVSGSQQQTTPLALSILAALPPSNLSPGSTQAAGGTQSGGTLQNTALAMEPVAALAAKNTTETLEVRHGFLPTPEPSLP